MAKKINFKMVHPENKNKKIAHAAKNWNRRPNLIQSKSNPQSSKLPKLVKGKEFDATIFNLPQIEIVFMILENDKSNNNSAAYRIGLQKNKLLELVSLFLDNNGGILIYGVFSYGIVCGEIMSEDDRKNVSRKINTEIARMAWPKHVDHRWFWTVEFLPVSNTAGDEMYVIQIGVDPSKNKITYLPQIQRNYAPSPRKTHVRKPTANASDKKAYSDRDFFERKILNKDTTIKKEYKKKLERLPWVENFMVVDGHGKCNERHLQIVCKIGEVPRTVDIKKLFHEKRFPVITYKKLSKTEWFETNILDKKFKMKEEYECKLLRLEWVESFQLVGESKNRHVEIVYEFGKAPRVPDIVNLFGENILPFIRYREGSKNEWFEENILDENYDMKDIYLNELISERFSWVKDFYIGVTRHPENSWQIYITYARDKKPSMKDMRKLFGVNIASFVDFIPESNADDNELRTSSCFLRAPCSGDPLYVKNEERGTIAILATQLSDTDDHYAVTCYHVCYCESELPDNINDAHKKLKEDCGSKNSAGCAGIGWHYINEDTELGKFERGLYNDSNDIALIKLASGLTCDDATTLLKDGVESELLSKKEVGQLFSKYMKNGKLPKVKKYGSITKETEGELIALSGVTENETKPGMNKGFYRIQGTGGSAFAEPGDSGALVYIVDEGKNLPFAIVSNQNENKDIFYCQNLRKGLEELCSEIEPCLNQCGLKITRLH